MEKATGERLHELAEGGDLPGVKSVEGAPEIKGQKSGDYRLKLDDGTTVSADLIEPQSSNPATPAGRVIGKQSQAEIAVIRLGKGESVKMPVDALKAEIQSRVFETPDVRTQRVIIMTGMAK